MAAEPVASRRLVFVAARDPSSARRGDQLRALQLVGALAREWQVTLLAPAARDASALPALAAEVEVQRYRRTVGDRLHGVLRAAVGGEPLQAGLYGSRDLRARLAAEAARSALVVVQMVRSTEALRGLVARTGGSPAPVLVDFIDCLSLAFERRAAVDSRWRRKALQHESRRLARAEHATLRRVAAAAVVCGRDREAMLERADGPPGFADKLSVLPLAMEPAVAPARAEEAGPRTIALTGNLGYFVNWDAARWFLDAVWPALRSARPEVRLVVAGARASGLAARARAAGAELVAEPHDLRALLADATVAIAPMRCGAGVPVKVLEAWAVGTPVVASSWAAAGTAATADRELLVADQPDEWLRQITRLLDDAELRGRLAASARALLERQHAPPAVARAVRAWARAAAVSGRTAVARGW
jgi:glycosyltransferase involved in cell wall biosynthesis